MGGVGPAMDLLTLPFVGMLLFAVLAVFAAFFARRSAKWLVGFAIGIFLLISLSVLSLNHGDVGWTISAMFGLCPLCLFNYASAILCAIALWAPLRHPDIVLPDGSSIHGQPRWRWFYLFLSLTVGIFLYFIAIQVDRGRGVSKAMALLAADTDVRLRQIAIADHHRKIVCTDPDVLRYVERQFHNHGLRPERAGSSCLITLTFAGGGSQDFYSYFADDGAIEFFIGEPGEGGKAHGIRFPHPRPKAVDEMLTFLLADLRSVNGQVMTVENGKTQIKLDTSR